MKRDATEGATSMTGKDVADLVAGKLADYKRLRREVIIIDEIPKRPSGKILRKLLRERKDKTRKAKL